MQRALVIALLFGLPAGAYGTECAAGYTHKADLTGATCATQETTAASCNSGCCEKNKATCGGLEVTCPWGTYAAGDDAWKNKAATEKTKNVACCQPKVSCANTFITTPVGKKRKTTGATIKCPSDPKSCTQGSLCFENDVKTCGGAHADDAGTNTCAASKAPSADGDAWKSTKITGTFAADCCKTSLKCDATDVVCPAGQKLKGTPGGITCTPKATYTGGAAGETAILSDCGRDGGACCEANTETCGGNTDPCNGDATFTPGGKDAAWKAKTNADKLADGDKKKATCCVAKAKCSQGTPPAGYKAIAGSADLPCTGDVASCTTTPACFEKDVKKCGGLTGIACPYGFINEQAFFTKETKDGVDTYTPAKAVQDEWSNKPATEETKNTACCTPVAICSLTGTTTPAATATPAAPALKFSQRKVAIGETSDRPWGTNMVWLGVGGLVGMSVLMVVQGLRSRMQTDVADAREVDVLLEERSLD